MTEVAEPPYPETTTVTETSPSGTSPLSTAKTGDQPIGPMSVSQFEAATATLKNISIHEDTLLTLRNKRK
jgi:hypothetical protein